MDLSSAKTANLVENGTMAAAGFFGFIQASTAKYVKNYAAANITYNLWSKNRIEDAIANIVGGKTVQQIDSTYTNPGFAAQGIVPHISIGTVLNNVTYAGAGLLIADAVLKEVVPAKYYKSVPVIPDAVHGTGIGLLVGGIVGGLFDPTPSNAISTSYPSAQGTFVPSPRAARVSGNANPLSWN